MALLPALSLALALASLVGVSHASYCTLVPDKHWGNGVRRGNWNLLTENYATRDGAYLVREVKIALRERLSPPPSKVNSSSCVIGLSHNQVAMGNISYKWDAEEPLSSSDDHGWLFVSASNSGQQNKSEMLYWVRQYTANDSLAPVGRFESIAEYTSKIITSFEKATIKIYFPYSTKI